MPMAEDLTLLIREYIFQSRSKITNQMELTNKTETEIFIAKTRIRNEF